jgi:hypothetical protein
MVGWCAARVVAHRGHTEVIVITFRTVTQLLVKRMTNSQQKSTTQNQRAERVGQSALFYALHPSEGLRRGKDCGMDKVEQQGKIGR